MDDYYQLVYFGTNIQQFWREYLLPWRKTPQRKERNNVLFCPTDRYHRSADMAPSLDESVPVFPGYFLLPYHNMAGINWDYDIAGLRGWHAKTKFDGEFGSAPILVDRIQPWARGRTEGSFEILSWNPALPNSNHAGRDGVPDGGNFLFEDGRVQWYRLQQIGVGSTGVETPSTDAAMYKIRF